MATKYPPPSAQSALWIWLDRGTQEVGQSLPLLPTTPPAVTRGTWLCVPDQAVQWLVLLQGRGGGSWEWAVSGRWTALLLVSMLSRKSWGPPCLDEGHPGRGEA